MTETIETPVSTGRTLDVTRLPWTEGLVELPQGATSGEFLEAAGLDWEVDFQPLLRPVPDVIRTEDGAYAPNLEAYDEGGNRRWSVAPDIKDVIRVNQAKVLGQVKSDYVITQNREAYEFADHLVDSREARWIAGGSLYDDKVVYGVMSLDGLQITVGGDDVIDTFILIRTSHNGGTGVQVNITPMRIRCANMIPMAISRAKHRWTFRHVSTLKGRLQQARDTLELATKYVVDDYQRELERLIDTQLSADRARELIEKTVPTTRGRREAVVEGIMTAYRDERYNGYEGTAYGLFNAYTDYMDHVIPRQSATSRLQEQLDGEGRTGRDTLARLLVNA